MGRRSKASLARLLNLSKAPSRPYKATVEDAPDSDANGADYIMNDDTGSINDACSDKEGDDGLNGIKGRFFILEDDLSDSDLDSVDGSDLEDMDMDDDEEVEIKNDAALLTFSAVLQQAQQTAVAAEKKKCQRKRPKYYARNSNCTLRRHALKWRKLESEGQSFISKWAHGVRAGTKSSAAADTFACGKKQPVSVSHYSELILKLVIEESDSQPLKIYKKRKKSHLLSWLLSQMWNQGMITDHH